jgi:adenylate cyclase class 2
MQTEFEATFLNIDKSIIRNKLNSIGAKLIKPEFLQKRVVYNLPTGHEIEGGWLRVRDEGDKITMSLKIVKKDSSEITDQKELQLIINDFNEGDELLKLIGCEKKAYQESRRELWMLEETEITIDEWPFLKPLVEIEGKSEAEVIKISEMLGFEYSTAYFGSADGIYAKEYDIDVDVINEQTPLLTFDMKENPLLNRNEKK